MSDERIITAAAVTTGEKSDGHYHQALVEKSKNSGMEIETVIGDTAYSGKENLQYAKSENLQFVSKLNPNITGESTHRKLIFDFNKDAGMYVCPAGHMAIRKARTGKKNQCANQAETNYFEIEKCKICPMREGCYKRSYSKIIYIV